MTDTNAQNHGHSPAGGGRDANRVATSATESSPIALIGGMNTAPPIAPASRGGMAEGKDEGGRMKDEQSVRIHPSSFILHPSRQRGFSLTEILIVIAIIVLMLALALPAFNFISGGKSIDGAQNTLSALLARARVEAVGVQEIRGVLFYYDQNADRVMTALVKDVSIDQSPVLLDTVDGDQVALPKGICLEIVRSESKATPPSDKYMGFNDAEFDPSDSNQNSGKHGIYIGGAILFDGNGRLTNVQYGLRMQVVAGSGPEPSPLAKVLRPEQIVLVPNYADHPVPFGPAKSAFALVLFEQGVFVDKFGDGNAAAAFADPWFAGSATLTGKEPEEETWLNENATAVTINRYNGTLIKGD